MKKKLALLCSCLFISMSIFAGTINPFTISSKYEQRYKDYKTYSGNVVMHIRSGTEVKIASAHIQSEKQETIYQGNVAVIFPFTHEKNQFVVITSDKVTVRKEQDNSITLLADSIKVHFESR
ncbi:hypothetical protein [Photobacterium angustum]|uniref:Uncharacterized protein n=1 Tax=Photobacterium angustum TaxID=661 RepID=A0A855S9T6_PHOAN|nr:hypothetical protein [Photobacterium angustum]KJF79982.1 hypothetical protein UB36_19515 [Photobacterium damselae subsp. damselae]KJG40117.1 hypothetical protein UA35_12620 [Photobacterium angustum]KJG43459.1 hypothetical protein UA31_19520 [Photobacterium angustum]KJG48460.1 hypothetical protein UA30_13160 [Photobacterium angustum]KJG52343.1 hypothetical protein UA34_14030 [Photobacterium angustum]